MANTPIRSPEVMRLTASAMCNPVRSWRTIIVRMSASAAASMIGLTGYPIRNFTPSRFKMSATTAAAFTRVSLAGIGAALWHSTSFAANDPRSAGHDWGSALRKLRSRREETGSGYRRRGASGELEVGNTGADDQLAPCFRGGGA